MNTVYASTLSETLGKVTEIQNGGNLESIINTIVDIAMPVAGLVAVVLMIAAGYKMITSQGNPDKLKDAKEMITNAVIGLVFILLSIAILFLIASVFNIDIS